MRDRMRAECDRRACRWRMPCVGAEVATRWRIASRCTVRDAAGTGHRHRRITVPKIGATPFGYRVAEQFGLASCRHASAGAAARRTAPEHSRTELRRSASVSVDAGASCGADDFARTCCSRIADCRPAILQISPTGDGDAPGPIFCRDVDVAPACSAAADGPCARRASERAHDALASVDVARAAGHPWQCGFRRARNESRHDDNQSLATHDRLASWSTTAVRLLHRRASTPGTRRYTASGIDADKELPECVLDLEHSCIRRTPVSLVSSIAAGGGAQVKHRADGVGDRPDVRDRHSAEEHGRPPAAQHRRRHRRIHPARGWRRRDARRAERQEADRREQHRRADRAVDDAQRASRSSTSSRRRRCR